jgi:hypothetical protein
MDLELESAVGAIGDEHGIVEIARGLAVDGDDGQIAEVAAAIYFGWVDVGNGAGFGEDFFREDAGELMLTDHHFDVDAEVIGIAEDFDDATDGRSRGSRPAGDLNVDNEAFEVVIVCGCCRFASDDAMRSFHSLFSGYFLAAGDDDVLRHAIVKWNEPVARFAIGSGVVKDADDSRIATLEDAGDASETATVGAGRGEFDEDFIALHGAVDLIGRDKDVIVFCCSLTRIGADETVAVAMEIETAGEQVVAGCAGGLPRNGPMLTISFDEVAARRDASQLLKEQTALTPAAQTDFADELLIAGFASGGTGNMRQQFAVVHRSRVEQPGDS